MPKASTSSNGSSADGDNTRAQQRESILAMARELVIAASNYRRDQETELDDDLEFSAFVDGVLDTLPLSLIQATPASGTLVTRVSSVQEAPARWSGFAPSLPLAAPTSGPTSANLTIRIPARVSASPTRNAEAESSSKSRKRKHSDKNSSSSDKESTPKRPRVETNTNGPPVAGSSNLNPTAPRTLYPDLLYPADDRFVHLPLVRTYAFNDRDFGVTPESRRWWSRYTSNIPFPASSASSSVNVPPVVHNHPTAAHQPWTSIVADTAYDAMQIAMARAERVLPNPFPPLASDGTGFSDGYITDGSSISTTARRGEGSRLTPTFDLRMRATSADRDRDATSETVGRWLSDSDRPLGSARPLDPPVKLEDDTEVASTSRLHDTAPAPLVSSTSSSSPPSSQPLHEPPRARRIRSRASVAMAASAAARRQVLRRRDATFARGTRSRSVDHLQSPGSAGFSSLRRVLSAPSSPTASL